MAVRTNPGVVAVSNPAQQRRVTYRAFDERIGRLATGLAAAGVGGDDRVGILGGIEFDTVGALHACWRVGAVPVPVDPTIGADRIAERFDRSDVSTAIATASIDEPPAVAEPVETLIAEPGSAAVSPEGRQGTDLAAILYTSGTTGAPSPVVLTWENLRTSAMASALRLGVLPEDRWLVCLQPYHMGGFAPYIRAAFYGTGVILASPTPSSLSDAIQHEGATGVSLVPTLLERCLEEGVPLEELRTVLVGGDRTAPQLIERAVAAEIPIYCSYGMTEAASQIATARPREVADQPETVGHPLRWVTVDIVDADGASVPPGERGEIIAAGPTITPGYLDGSHPDRFTATGALRTGDEGYVDDAGRLFVTGRRSDRIVTGGETVDPRSIERILESHRAVDAAAVLGLPDATWGERVGAVLESSDDIDGGTVLADLGDSFTSAERPRTVRVIDSIPRTESGTVHRPSVRRILDSED